MKWMMSCLVALVLVMVGFHQGAAQENGPQAISHRAIPCPMNLPAGEVEGETIVCGQIEVPEDWDDPSGTTIPITYAITRSTSSAPFSDPVIYFDGGPGISALEEIEAITRYFDKLRPTRDVIYWDQRGTRYSAALECPPEVQARPPATEPVLPDNAEELLSSIENITLESDPATLLQVYGYIAPGADVLNCAQYFAEQGIDLSEYSTANTVRDSIALLGALGYPTYNLYGISYGTTGVTEVMRYYDEHPEAQLPAIRSIVIDGNIPLFVDINDNTLFAGPTVVLTVLGQCEADPACAESYPNIRQRALDLLAGLQETPLVVDESTTISAADLRSVMLSTISDRQAVVYLPRLVDELERGVADVYLRLQAGTLPGETGDALPTLADPYAALGYSTDTLADQLRLTAEQLAEVSAQSQRLSDILTSEEPLPAAFAEEFVSSLEQRGNGDAVRRVGPLSGVFSQPPSRELLVQIVSFLPELERNLLLGLIGLMSDDDIAAAFALLRDPAYAKRLEISNALTHTIIQCNDYMPSFDIEAAWERMRQYEGALLLDPSQAMITFALNCGGYGLTPEAAPVPQPVTNSSGFPVLVSNGRLDEATAMIWGEQAFENLQNARMLTFSQSFHGASQDSDCAMDITNAYFTYPDAELNTACMASLEPVFVLPNDALPELPAS